MACFALLECNMARTALVLLSLCIVGCASSGDRPSARSPEKYSDTQVAEAVKEHNEAVEDEKDKVICTRESVVGSHFSRRVCRSLRQLEEEREYARRMLEDQLPPPAPDG
jgi:hypothetical protein